MGKFYAVRKGKKPGIYESWEECKLQIDGFPGQEYKAFKNREDAESYLTNLESGTNIQTQDIKLLTEQNSMNAFTDGSFDEELNISSYGIVFIDNSGKVTTKGGFLEDSFGSRNITGEIEAVIEAINRALFFKIKKLKIFYDYNGIGKWALKQFRAKTHVSIRFVNFLDEIKDKIEIVFVHVKGHSGVEYNDMADTLASNQIKSLKPSVETTWGFTSYRYSDTDIEKMLREMKGNYDNFDYLRESKSNHFIYQCHYEKVRITIRKYFLEAGNALLVERGTNEALFALVVSHLNDFGRVENIIPILNAQFKTHIEKSSLEETLFTIAPKLKNKSIDIQVYRLIIQAMYNYVQDFEDFGDLSYLIIPATRALEGHLKVMFKEVLNISITNNGFHYFDKDDLGIYTLQSAHVALKREKDVELIEKCYNLLVSTRHVFAHFGNPDLHDTRFLNAKDSKEKIKDIILVISEYY
ncbi:MAG: viroplasmin family protein [Acholeplasmataceae bacterium]|nr:viroplasmin family protein [Acholeplasmataceae bacterium]